MRTPWGEADTIDRPAPGITVVGTPSHGGIHLSATRQAQVPLQGQQYAERFSGSRSWYEEDVAASIPILLFPELAEYFGKWNGAAEQVVKNARSALRFYGYDYILDAIDKANAQGELCLP